MDNSWTKPKSENKQKKSKYKYARLIVAGIFGLLVFFCLPFFTSTVKSNASVAYVSQQVMDDSVELNDSSQKQAGSNGTNEVTYLVRKSLLNMVLGSENERKQVFVKVVKAPTNKITAIGTKKYQYMYCSNGNYRYYTDEQFKTPNVGFTHKSIDYCAKNNEGTMTQLADSAPRSSGSSSNSSYAFSSIPNCTTTTIPYGTDYKSVSWLPVGQTQTMTGLNGTYFSCLHTSVQPLNATVYVGTGISYNATAQYDAQAYTKSQAYAKSQARAKCKYDYSSAKAQISIAGAGNDSAMDYLNQLYSQCLNEAQ